jgi:hypothetical protein
MIKKLIVNVEVKAKLMYIITYYVFGGEEPPFAVADQNNY